MSPLPASIHQDFNLLLDYPIKQCLTTTLVTYIASLITGNVSQVDRIWTVMPTMYTAYWALLPLWPHGASWGYITPYVPEEAAHFARDFSPRALLMLGLTVVWMFRLSYNAWRRGMFNPNEEDYRWAVLRKKIPPWLFQITNLVFIAAIQNILLLLMATPALIAATHPSPLTLSDIILSLTALALIAFESIADNQQFAFHAWKHGKYDAREHWPGARLAWTKDDAARGFCTRGLWSWSRHPNFFAEQSFWGVLNLIPILALPNAPALVPPHKSTLADALRTLVPLAPSLALCLLFISSTRFTESISLSKYPRGYAAYRSRVAMFVPFLTPIWGAVLSVTGRKREVEELVWGSGAREAEVKDRVKAE